MIHDHDTRHKDGRVLEVEDINEVEIKIDPTLDEDDPKKITLMSIPTDQLIAMLMKLNSRNDLSDKQHAYSKLLIAELKMRKMTKTL